MVQSWVYLKPELHVRGISNEMKECSRAVEKQKQGWVRVELWLSKASDGILTSSWYLLYRVQGFL